MSQGHFVSHNATSEMYIIQATRSFRVQHFPHSHHDEVVTHNDIVQMYASLSVVPVHGSICMVDADCDSLLNSQCRIQVCRCSIGYGFDATLCRSLLGTCTCHCIKVQWSELHFVMGKCNSDHTTLISILYNILALLYLHKIKVILA